MSVDTEYLYVAMLKGLMSDKNFAITVTNAFDESFFEEQSMVRIFRTFKSHLETYNTLPDRDIVINSISKENREAAEILLRDADATDFDVAKNYDWLREQTNSYLKERAIKQSIIKAVDVIDRGGNFEEIKILVEAALCKDININLGLDYFGAMKDRLTRIFTSSDNRIKTYYPTLDELFNGGYPPYTLNMMIAKVHGHKTNIMTNIIARQVMNGVNVGLATLEMSEDMYAQRFDANLTNLDINRIYHNAEVKPKFIKSIQEVKNEALGKLWIKEYPTGRATVADFRRWLRELKMRGIDIHILFCDYLSLMKAEMGNVGDMYRDGKSISEELRALGFEFGIPVVTVAQINRAGTFLDFDTLDMNSIGESWGIPGTADSLLVQGFDVNDALYKSEIKWKCCKNRLGGRVGTMGKWYYDDRSLKMYDQEELDLWVNDVSISNGDRSLYERVVR
jgi:replicative DNA helicase